MDEPFTCGGGGDVDVRLEGDNFTLELDSARLLYGKPVLKSFARGVVYLGGDVLHVVSELRKAPHAEVRATIEGDIAGA